MKVERWIYIQHDVSRNEFSFFGRKTEFLKMENVFMHSVRNNVRNTLRIFQGTQKSEQIEIFTLYIFHVELTFLRYVCSSNWMISLKKFNMLQLNFMLFI